MIPSTWRRPADLVWCEDEGGGAYIVLPGTVEISVLSDTACLIWQCAQGRPNGDVVTHVADIEGVDPSVIRADVLACLEQLVELKLLVREIEESPK